MFHDYLRMRLLMVFILFLLILTAASSKKVSNPAEIKATHFKVDNGGACQKEIITGKEDYIHIAAPKDNRNSSCSAGADIKRILTTKQIEFLQSLGWNTRRDSPVIRKEIRQLSDVDRVKLLRAVSTMQKEKLDDTFIYDLFVKIHLPMIGPAGSRTGASQWGWHREYLLRFEDAVRKYFSDAAIPYWDFTLDAYLPEPADSVLWTDDFFGYTFPGVAQDTNVGDSLCTVDSGYFAKWKLCCTCEAQVKFNIMTFFAGPEYRNQTQFVDSRVKKFGSYLTRNCFGTKGKTLKTFNDREVEILMGINSFDTMSSKNCLTKDHDTIHEVFVKGEVLLGDASCAVADPALWFFHAYLDKLWELWRTHTGQNDSNAWPTNDEEQGVCRRSYDPMLPFNGLNNIDGVGPKYMSKFYKYSTAPYACGKNSDCGSKYLWCDATYGRCMSKIRLGGSCGGYPDDICFSGTCNDANVCAVSSNS